MRTQRSVAIFCHRHSPSLLQYPYGMLAGEEKTPTRGRVSYSNYGYVYIRYTRHYAFTYYYPIKQEKHWYRAFSCLSWCRRRDPNSCAIVHTAAWRQRICRSTTPACFMMLNHNTLKKMICLPLNGKRSFFYLTFPAMIANAGRYPICAWKDI